jgi:hypothetical protein
VQYLSLINFVLLQTDGEHQEHRHRSWPAGAEQPRYRPAAADASTSDSGAVLPTPDADDGHSEQHCSNSAADPCSAATSSTAAAPRQVCRLLRGHPPTFSHAADPLQANDWLHSVERQLDVAQCDDRERVLYAAGQLRGSALDWWESYPAWDRDILTWVQFRERFRNHHIPVGVMKMKHKEFLALKQVN